VSDNVENRFETYIYIYIKRWEGHVACIGQMRGVYRVLVGKTEGKTLLGKPRRRWENNIKIDLQEVRCLGYGLDLAGSGEG